MFERRLTDPNVRLYRLMEEWLDLRNALEESEEECEKVERRTLTFCLNSLKNVMENM